MKAAVFMLLLLMIAGIALVYWHMTHEPPSTVVYNTTTVEADKRKQIGGSFMGTGINFAW